MAKTVTAPIRSGRRSLCIEEIISPVEEKRAEWGAQGRDRRVEERSQFGGQWNRLRWVRWKVRRAGPGGPAQARAPAPRFEERSQFRGWWVLIQRVVVAGRWGGRPWVSAIPEIRRASARE